jgi:hypothetical protein
MALSADRHLGCKLPWCNCDCHAPFSARRAADIEAHPPADPDKAWTINLLTGYLTSPGDDVRAARETGAILSWDYPHKTRADEAPCD